MLPQRAWPLAISLLLALLLLVPYAATAQEDPEVETETLSEQGYCTNPQVDNAGSTWQRSYWFEGRTILSFEATLSWSDDESGVTAVPDTFGLSIREGGGTEASQTGSGGNLLASIDAGELDSNWTVTVQCLEAGRAPGPLGLVGDAGNAWSLEIVYTYEATEAPGGPGPGGPPPNIAALYDDPIFWTHVVFMITSTYMFGIVGVLAAVTLYSRNRWRDEPSRWKRALATNRPFRALAVHVWMVFFIAAVPLGMYVSGKAYGWENAWTSFPAVWNPWFYDITNADNVSLIVLILWAIPLWLNRQELMASRPHYWLFGRIGWFRRFAARAPVPRLTAREMAIIFFIMGIFVWLVFVVQPHGN